MIQFPETKMVQKFLKMGVNVMYKVELYKEIYIPQSLIDQLHKDSYKETDRPFIVENRSGMNFQMASNTSVNLDDYVKVHVISSYDWGKVNWKKGRLHDPLDEDPVHLEAIILFIHGGGFISTSTTVYQPMLRKMSKETGYPVFSVDYRLAPDYPHPTPLND